MARESQLHGYALRPRACLPDSGEAQPETDGAAETLSCVGLHHVASKVDRGQVSSTPQTQSEESFCAARCSCYVMSRIPDLVLICTYYLRLCPEM